MKSKRISLLIALVMCAVFAFVSQAWSGQRDNVVNYAYEILNYEWNTSGYILLNYSGYEPDAYSTPSLFSAHRPIVATGTLRGIPYTLSANGNGAEKSFAEYKALSDYDRQLVSNVYSYGGNAYRVGAKYGMSCATFVWNCVSQAFPNLTRTAYCPSIPSLWSSYLSGTSYSELKKGDILWKSSHVMLVVDNNPSSSSLTVIEQTPPNIGNTRYAGTIYLPPHGYFAAEIYDTYIVGTREKTYSYSSVSSYTAYSVNYDGEESDTSGINPGLLKLNTTKYAKCFTLEDKEYRGGSGNYLYTDSSLRTLKPYENWTGKDDEIHLTGVGKTSSGTIWGRISYPSGSNRVTVYVKLQDVLVSDGTITDDEPKKAKVRHYGMYKRRDSGYESSYGIDVGDDVYLLTKSNGWCQVMYPITGQTYWRIAWLKESDYDKVIGKIKPLEITEVPTKTVVAGQYFEFQCEANGNVDAWSIAPGTRPSGSSTNVKITMPLGLSINRNTGRISGTVGHTSLGKSSNMPMYYYFKVKASGSGNSAEKGAVIEVVEPPVITTDRNLPNGSLGQAYNQTITAESTARGMKWKLKSGSLPDGLKINFNNAELRTATITGNPTRAGTYTFKVQLSNYAGSSEYTTTKTFTIKIGEEPVPDPNMYIAYTFMDGKVGKYYNNDWVAARGRDSINRATVSGNYPTGLSFYRSGLKVYMYGTPEESGTFEFTITVYSDYGYANKTFRVYIAPKDTRPYPDPNMSIVYTLCNGSLGNTYGDYVRVSGGTSPYTVQVVSGTLPPGLSATAEGSKIWIRGVPARYSSTPYTFRLRVTGAHNGYAEKELNIKISNNSSYSLAGAGDPDKPTKPKLLTKKLPTAAIGNEVNVQLEAYGTTPITWSCENVPEGFIFTDTGVIMGVPMEAKNLKFKVTATNSVGSAAKSFTLKVKPEKPLITTLTLPDGVVGLPYEFTPEASGTEPLTWSKSGKFPSGLKIDRKTGTISGTPKKAGMYEFKLKAKNKGGTDTVQMTIIINAEEQEKTSSVSASSFVQLRTESRGSVNTELFVIADGEDIEDDVITDAGQPLTFRTGKWVDDAGNEIEVSDVQICINDEPVNNIEAAEDGTFTLPGSYVSGEFCVSARAKYGESELETSDINVTAEAHNEEISLSDSDSSGSCSTNLFGFAGLALCALMAFRKK